MARTSDPEPRWPGFDELIVSRIDALAARLSELSEAQREAVRRRLPPNVEAALRPMVQHDTSLTAYELVVSAVEAGCSGEGVDDQAIAVYLAAAAAQRRAALGLMTSA